MGCKHKSYKAILRPRVKCDVCWWKYLCRHYILTETMGMIKR